MNSKTAKTLDSEDSEQVIFAGCDDGHDSIKLKIVIATHENGQLIQNEAKQLVMPSKVVRGNRVLSLTGDDASGNVYRTQAPDSDLMEEFTVTDGISGNDIIDTRSIPYPVSTVNRVLVHDALRRAGLGGKNVRLVTGLPVSDYYTNQGQNKALIDQKRANIQTGHIEPLRKSASAMAQIETHQIACEGISAVYDLAIRDDGTDDPDFFKLLEQAPVGVIDIGGKTIDLAVVYLDHGQHQVDRHRTSSLNYGMLRLMDSIRNEIRLTHHVEDIAPRAMHRILSQQTIMLSGEVVDVSNEVQTAISKASPDLFNRIQSVWGKAHDLSRVIVVGGGSYLLAQTIKEGLYKHSESRPEPEFANARGMLKMAMRSYIANQRQLSNAG